MIFILLTATVLLMDLGIKFTIENADPSLFPRTIEKTKGLIMLHRNHNEGFPFGALKEKKELVKQLPLAVVSAVAGIFAWLFPRKGYIVEKAGLALIIGGGLSNLYDRMKRGYVVDYFSIRWKGLKKVVFNLGDICVFLGAAILLAAELARTIKEES
ncbi:MAG: signal peptidase II [Hungatella sp.]|jgi:signal peptidase II|nr:signal peptidase II [Hungatella sp.]